MAESVGTGRGTWPGTWSLLSGIIALAGVLMIGQSSFGWITGWDPVGWLRVLTGWMLPVGALAALVLGGVSISRRRRRPLGIAGIALALVAIGIFVVMIVSNPY